MSVNTVDDIDFMEDIEDMLLNSGSDKCSRCHEYFLVECDCGKIVS